jgi:hypothetical protein
VGDLYKSFRSRSLVSQSVSQSAIHPVSRSVIQSASSFSISRSRSVRVRSGLGFGDRLLLVVVVVCVGGGWKPRTRGCIRRASDPQGLAHSFHLGEEALHCIGGVGGGEEERGGAGRPGSLSPWWGGPVWPLCFKCGVCVSVIHARVCGKPPPTLLRRREGTDRLIDRPID